MKAFIGYLLGIVAVIFLLLGISLATDTESYVNVEILGVEYDEFSEDYVIIADNNEEYDLDEIALSQMDEDAFFESIEEGKVYELLIVNYSIYEIYEGETCYLAYEDVMDEVAEKITELVVLSIVIAIIIAIPAVVLITSGGGRNNKKVGIFGKIQKKFMDTMEIVVNDRDIIFVKDMSKNKMDIANIQLQSMPAVYNIFCSSKYKVQYEITKKVVVTDVARKSVNANIYVPTDYSLAEREAIKEFMLGGKIKFAEVIGLEAYFKDKIVNGVLVMTNVRAINIVGIRDGEIVNKLCFDKSKYEPNDLMDKVNQIKQTHMLQNLFIFDPDCSIQECHEHARQIINL